MVVVEAGGVVSIGRAAGSRSAQATSPTTSNQGLSRRQCIASIRAGKSKESREDATRPSLCPLHVVVDAKGTMGGPRPGDAWGALGGSLISHSKGDVTTDEGVAPQNDGENGVRRSVP
jgi:hypothetical protein